MDTYQNHPLAGARDLDTAMAKLWAFYKKYFIGLYIISIVMTVLTGLATSGIDLAAIQSTTDPEEMLQIMKGMAGPYLLVIAISLVFSVMLHAWILEKPLGQGNALVKALKSCLVALVPYLLVMILVMLAGGLIVAVGLVMFILPGLFAMIYVGTIAIFVMPVTLVESRNPGKVLSRSLTLAHSNFWQNLAWVVVIALIVIVISVVVGALVMLPFTGSVFKSFTDPDSATSVLEMSKNPFYIVLSALATSLVTPVFPILAFIIYFRNSQDVTVVEVQPEESNQLKVEDLYPKMPDDDKPKASE